MNDMQTYQADVNDWVVKCFGEEAARDNATRAARFLEEALELFQALNMGKADAMTLVDYVYNRPIGEVRQEVGGILVTLMALCTACGVDASDAAVAELARVNLKVDKIRAKQASKPAGVLPKVVDESEVMRYHLEALRESLLRSGDVETLRKISGIKVGG